MGIDALCALLKLLACVHAPVREGVGKEVGEGVGDEVGDEVGDVSGIATQMNATCRPSLSMRCSLAGLRGVRDPSVLVPPRIIGIP